MGKSVWFMRTKCDNLLMPSLPAISFIKNEALLADIAAGSQQECRRLVMVCYDAQGTTIGSKIRLLPAPYLP
jgi:hypothetical protein